MSEMTNNSNTTQLSQQMMEMIEHKRRLAIEKRNKRKAIEMNKPIVDSYTTESTLGSNTSSNSCLNSNIKQNMTFIKSKEKSVSNYCGNTSDCKPTTPYSRPNEPKAQIKASIRLISNKRFELEIGYNTPVIKVLNGLKSKDWNPTTKRWTFDLNDYKKMIIELKTISSVEIRFSDSVPDRVINALIDSRNVSKEDIDLKQRLSTPLMERLFAFQAEGVIFGIRTGGRCLIADDMGLGKTLQAICIAQWFREDWPLLIVCPTALCIQWRNSLIEWLPNIKEKDVLIVKKKNEILHQMPITIISYALMGLMRSHFNLEYKQIYNFVILDESHYIKSDLAARTEAVHALAKKTKRVVLLTGTPALSRPMEIFTQIQLIDPKLFPSKHEFGVRYCDAQFKNIWLKSKSKNGKPVNKQIWDYKGAKNLEELRILLEATFLVRRLKSEVLNELTKKKREMIIIKVDHLNEKERNKLKKYSNIVKNFSFKREDNTCLFDWYMDSGLAKVEPVCNYLEQLLNQNIKLLCFCHHKQMMDGIQDILSKKLINHIRIDGSTPTRDRQEACDEFQMKDTCRVALLSITACATGLNLTSASTVVFAEIYWNPGILSQAEDRVHRIGQKKDVKIYYLVAKDTIDDMLWPMISKKLEILNKAGLSKDNFEEATTTLDALDSEQHLITEFFESLDESEKKALIDDNF